MHPILFHIDAVLIPSYGAVAALGVLAALFLAQRTARAAGVNPAQIWNLCVVAVFAALIGQRLLLIVVNWSVLRLHPSWALGLAMVHHPLLAAAGAFAGAIAAAAYIRWQEMPVWSTGDALAAPLALGLAFEQLGALLAGSGYGIDARPKLPWAVTYTSIFAARWSGTPLGVPLHPVQAYAALALLALAVFLFVWMPLRRRPGDLAGLCLMGLGTIIFITEIWRDSAGRGHFLDGALDAPQIAAVLLVIAGGFVLRERGQVESSGLPPIPPKSGGMDGAQSIRDLPPIPLIDGGMDGAQSIRDLPPIPLIDGGKNGAPSMRGNSSGPGEAPHD